MSSFKLVIFITFFLLSFQYSYSQNWMEKLIPLQTKIDEIEKILIATPFNAKILKESALGDRHIFYHRDGTLVIYFSLGHCVDGFSGKYELEKGVIIQASFKPKKWRKISYYEKDVKALKKDSTSTILYYENEKKGIGYDVQNSRVSAISFFGPPEIDLVRCKD